MRCLVFVGLRAGKRRRINAFEDVKGVARHSEASLRRYDEKSGDMLQHIPDGA
jgi:hypothetical protein